MQISVLEHGHEVQSECSEVGATVEDGPNTGRHKPVGFADVGSHGVERAVYADVLHKVEMHWEMAESGDRGYRGKNGVVETILVVKDWPGFHEHLLRYDENADVPDAGPIGWSHPLPMTTFTYFEILGRAERDICGATEGVLVYLDSQLGRKVHESERPDLDSARWQHCSAF